MLYSLKPVLLKLISYLPGGTVGNSKRPVSLLTVLNAVPVAGSTSLMATPGTAAADSSCTWPTMVPAIELCARTGIAAKLARRAKPQKKGTAKRLKADTPRPERVSFISPPKLSVVRQVDRCLLRIGWILSEGGISVKKIF